MGAPKQKWTAEEEAALRAGINKHGAGKWRTIIRDPEFSGVLYLRTNVDLKDKWRNMNVMVTGSGVREKFRLPVRRINVPEQGESSESPSNIVQSDEENVDAQAVEVRAQSKPTVELENLIMQAIKNLKELGGSNKSSIAAFIEDEYWAPPDFKRVLSTKLKFMTASGKLIKINRKYRIAPTSSARDDKRKSYSILFCNGRKNVTPRFGRGDFDKLTRDQIDLELARMETMSPEEAAAVAAQAVAEAEAAIAEAEEAEREAEAAEAAALAYLDGPKGRNSANI